MEKQAKSKNKILKFLPRAASAVSVSFQNVPPFSPGRDRRSSEIHLNKLKNHAGRGFSGPIISMIPDEARRKPKNGGFDSQEPTSPKVSCMGQIKHKKKMIKKAKRTNAPAPLPPQKVKAVTTTTTTSPPREIKKHASAIRRIFAGARKPAGRKSDASVDYKPALSDDHEAPCLSQMNRFASGRNSLADFDWMAQIAPVDREHRNYYSDEERGESDEEEEEVMIPFSAPMMMGGGVALQPRKEINLWKRRTMAPPRPLELITVDGASKST